MIPLMKDLSEVEISVDEDIQSTYESHHLHKISQYSMQYLFYCCDTLYETKHYVQNDYDMQLESRQKQMNDIMKQEIEIKRLEEETANIENENTHQKFCIVEEKENHEFNRIQKKLLVDKLKYQFEQEIDGSHKPNSTVYQNVTKETDLDKDKSTTNEPVTKDISQFKSIVGISNIQEAQNLQKTHDTDESNARGQLVGMNDAFPSFEKSVQNEKDIGYNSQESTQRNMKDKQQATPKKI